MIKAVIDFFHISTNSGRSSARGIRDHVLSNVRLYSDTLQVSYPDMHSNHIPTR